MIEIKTEALVKPLSDDSNLTTVYNRLKDAVDDADGLIYDIRKGKTNVYKNYFAQYDRDYKLIKLSKIDPGLVRQYEVKRDGYLEYEEILRQIFTCVKVGESQGSAVKKLAKLTQTLKNLKQSWRSSKTFFNPVSEEEILRDIERFDGSLTLIGTFDFDVEFKDGKVVKFSL